MTVVLFFLLAPYVRDGQFGFTMAALFLLSLSLLILVDLKERRAWKSLPDARLRFANKYKMQYFPKEWHISGLEQIAPSNIPGSRDEAYCNHLTSKDWEYCDFTYNYYKRTKHGEYKAGTVYYGLMFTRLPRTLPNVFFDSKNSRGRQFRFTFARKQKHSLEGNFDSFFTTYFPEDYTIDSMSFISPDVMLAMIDAAEYDIEIIGDVLCFYGPVSTAETDLITMSNKLLAVRSQLMDNIQTYRDERLPYAVGRKGVAVQGMALDKSKFLKRLTIAIAILYIVLRFAFAFVR